MIEPAWKTSRGNHSEPDAGFDDVEPGGISLLQRWVERPDGSLELLEIPLTPEDFLDPQLEDTLVQGRPHNLARHYFFDLLLRHFWDQKHVLVSEDLKHLFGPGLPAPAPDVSVVRGARHPEDDLRRFDAERQGVVPCLVIEIVSPYSKRIRETDKVDKVALYAQVGIPEYLLVDLPRPATRHRFEITGYRLGPGKRYQPIEPDVRGRLLSETTQLWFGVSPEGDRVDLFDARTGERLLTSREEEEARKAAEESRKAAEQSRRAAEEEAAREKAARRAAEEELERLRAEVERLRDPKG